MKTESLENGTDNIHLINDSTDNINLINDSTDNIHLINDSTDNINLINDSTDNTHLDDEKYNNNNNTHLERTISIVEVEENEDEDELMFQRQMERAGEQMAILKSREKELLSPSAKVYPAQLESQFTTKTELNNFSGRLKDAYRSLDDINPNDYNNKDYKGEEGEREKREDSDYMNGMFRFVKKYKLGIALVATSVVVGAGTYFAFGYFSKEI